MVINRLRRGLIKKMKPKYTNKKEKRVLLTVNKRRNKRKLNQKKE